MDDDDNDTVLEEKKEQPETFVSAIKTESSEEVTEDTEDRPIPENPKEEPP